jgi:cellulose synthase/poly-beta-1,6-N-acetylglucosamine synthase-like glycosyltransferase
MVSEYPATEARRTSTCKATEDKPAPCLSISAQMLLITVAILVTVVSSIVGCYFSTALAASLFRNGFVWAALVSVCGICLAGALLYGNLTHQIASWGHLKRRRDDPSRSTETPSDLFHETAPPLTTLVPSYKENLHLVRQTLLSVALQEYPNRRVVLLIDDPPYPTQRKDLDGLVAARRLPLELSALLAGQAVPLERSLEHFRKRQSSKSFNIADEMLRVSRHYGDVATWFLTQAAESKVDDHMDKMYVDSVLLSRAKEYAQRAEEFKHRANLRADLLTEEELLREYRRLASLFRVEITYFERKSYVNLSHELNKAMNLNSYIELIGKSYRMVAQPEGIELCESVAEDADLSIPNAKYVIVVDADSLLLPNYASSLIDLMEQPKNRRIAVAQSPYLAVPESPGLLERTAAATVAAQYVVHLGFSEFESIYWVGANAVLRKKALDEIRMPIRERGYAMVKYIQDRTHIEDTESTIDLVERGWTLYNCSDALAYSATPADFGSLLIQRRRWANGGLIVLPKLVQYLTMARRVPHRFLQSFLRIGYLLNLSLGSLAVLMSLMIPLPVSIIPCLVIAGICYGFVYAADILRMGFRFRDLPHIYALNLMLTPVNLGGAAKSLHQAWTGKKTPFARTPKTKCRTSVPFLYIAVQYVLLAFCVGSCIWSLAHRQTGPAAWTFINTIAYIHIVTKLLWNEAPELCA